MAEVGIGHNRPPEPDTQSPACPRVPVRSIIHLLPAAYLSWLRQNAPEPCCRNVLDHDIEALYSGEDRRAPDIYILHCTSCGRAHKRFCVGASIGSGGEHLLEYRPRW